MVRIELRCLESKEKWKIERLCLIMRVENYISGGKDMNRLTTMSFRTSQQVTEDLYKDLERRILTNPPESCPVDMAVSLLKMCHAQTCGKCVSCRIGLGQLQALLERVLDGEAMLSVIGLIETTARNIYLSADCAVGYQTAAMVLKSIHEFQDDYEEHILSGKCICNRRQISIEGEEKLYDKHSD